MLIVRTRCTNTALSKWLQIMHQPFVPRSDFAIAKSQITGGRRTTCLMNNNHVDCYFGDPRNVYKHIEGGLEGISNHHVCVPK